MFSGLRFEEFILLLSLECLVLEVLSVTGDVILQLGEGFCESVSLRDEDVVDQIVTVEEVSAGGVDLLLESDDFSVVLISTT